MDCTHLNTAAEVLEAFQACNNPGEEIELFECLATRPEPSLEAFVELLRSIKLEPVVALTIQAFGKITDADLKARLKQSDDLLAMLSQQVQSGSTDLIRWLAATTIEQIGFDFIAISRHLSEKPLHIAEKIVQSKIRRFSDQNLVQSKDYDEFIHFWTYGNRDELKKATLGIEFWSLYHRWQSSEKKVASRDEDFNKFDVCWKTMNALGLRGVKEVNTALQRAEAMGNDASKLDENEVFEGIGQILANIYQEDSGLTTNCLFLQSNNPNTRYTSAVTILKSEGSDFLDNLNQANPPLGLAVITFSKEAKSVSGSYSQLEKLARDLETLAKKLNRKKVRQDCQEWFNLILKELKERRDKFKFRKRQSANLRSKLDNNLKKIKSINNTLYNKHFDKILFDNPPELSLEDEKYEKVLDIYDGLIKDKLGNLRAPVNNFLEHFIEAQLAPLNLETSTAERRESTFKLYIENSYILSCLIAYIIVLICLAFLVELYKNKPPIPIWIAPIPGSFIGGFFLRMIVEPFLVKISLPSTKELTEIKTRREAKQLELETQRREILDLLSL